MLNRIVCIICLHHELISVQYRAGRAWKRSNSRKRRYMRQHFAHLLYLSYLSMSIHPFTTAGRKTDTIFEFFWVFLHTCHTVNNHLIALRFSEGFVHGLIFLGEKTELIYLYCSLFYTFSKKLVKFFEKRPKKCAHC